jgi:hypothetical protein
MIEVFFFIAFVVLAVINGRNATLWNKRVSELLAQDRSARSWRLCLDTAYTQFARCAVIGGLCALMALTEVVPIPTMIDLSVTLASLITMIYYGMFWTTKHPAK